MNIKVPDQRTILNHYRVQNQFGIHMEECAELIQSISKGNRVWGLKHPTSEQIQQAKISITEEIADVIICIEQLKIIYGITDIDIENWADYKFQRQLERIKNEGQ